MSTYQIPQLVPYGTIRRTHGHQGDLVIELYSDELMDAEPTFIFVNIDGIPVPFRVDDMRGTRDQLITTLNRIGDSESAKKLVGQATWIGADEAPKVNEEDITLHLLLGFRVKHTSGRDLGTITEIEDSTANVLLVISESDDTDPLLIPFVEDWVTDIDTDKRVLTFDCPLELLEL